MEGVRATGRDTTAEIKKGIPYVILGGILKRGTGYGFTVIFPACDKAVSFKSRLQKLLEEEGDIVVVRRAYYDKNEGGIS